MDTVISISVIVLAALVSATLQIGLGCLLLLFHSSKGKHPRKTTRRLVWSYIAGIGILSFLSVCAMCYVLLNIWKGPLDAWWLTVVIGILAIFTILMWLFYYRQGKGTELWIPKVVARFIDSRAKATNNSVEAFSLGMLTCFAELPFSLILFTVAANSILELPDYLQILMAFVYAVIAIIPVVIMSCCIHSGKTVVEVQRWRIKHKNFLRIIAGVGFLVLAFFLFGFKARGML